MNVEDLGIELLNIRLPNESIESGKAFDMF
jgi:hypothetical protein